MSCSCITPCNCSLGVDACPCEDPGLETSLRHAVGLDHAMCQRRLQNASGVLECFVNGSGTATIKWSPEPKLRYTELEVADNSPFSHLVAALGDNGIPRRLIPAEGADGFLRAKNGQWVLADFNTGDDGESLFTIPDPLTLTELNVTTLKVKTPTIEGTPTYSGLTTDTVTQTIGLNADNKLVKGSTPTISVAHFFENGTPLTNSSPNSTATSTTAAVVFADGVLYDSGGIATTNGSREIRVTKTGDYRIDWFGNFNGKNLGASAAGDNKQVGLWLWINDTITSWGTAKYVIQTNYRGTPVSGSHVTKLNAGDKITLRLAGDITTNKVALTGVGLVLTKFK